MGDFEGAEKFQMMEIDQNPVVREEVALPKGHSKSWNHLQKYDCILCQDIMILQLHRLVWAHSACDGAKEVLLV